MSRSRQAVMDGESGRGGSVVAGRLVEDMGEMIGHGFLTQTQSLCDLAVALALSNEPEDLYLSRGQAGWQHGSERITRLVCQRTQAPAHLAYRAGHAEFLEESKCLLELLPGAGGIALTTTCFFEVRLSHECPRQFRAQSLAPGIGLSRSQVIRCGFPLSIMERKQTQDTIDQEPVVLAPKGEQ